MEKVAEALEKEADHLTDKTKYLQMHLVEPEDVTYNAEIGRED